VRLRLPVALVLTLCPLLAPIPASAHAVLIDSTPAPLGHVPAGHLAVVFRYNSRIDAGRSRLSLVRPDGATDRLRTAAGSAPDLLRADLDLAPGAYVLSWQVLAVDGHVTRGRVPFTVDAPAGNAKAAGVAAQ
jgi:methionine-rich copper-binding protein CopC